MHKKVSVLSLVVGVALAISGFVLALPRPMTAGINVSNIPVMQFAPVLFILGVMLMLLSAVVYEVLPGGRD